LKLKPESSVGASLNFQIPSRDFVSRLSESCGYSNPDDGLKKWKKRFTKVLFARPVLTLFFEHKGKLFT
jgi:hypothetical protein